MSDDIRSDQARLGEHLPDVAKVRLQRLRTHLDGFRHLAQPGMSGQDALSVEWEHWSHCLTLLIEQLDQALGEASRPAHSATAASPGVTEGVAASSPAGINTAYATAEDLQVEPLVFGLTMGQFDALDRLIQMISAHGDVVSANGMADFAQGTLTMVGHALFDEARAVRDILEQMEDQRLPATGRPRFRVEEEQAVYRVGSLPAVGHSTSGQVLLGDWPPGTIAQRQHMRLQ